jgi:hypothetical protein
MVLFKGAVSLTSKRLNAPFLILILQARCSGTDPLLWLTKRIKTMVKKKGKRSCGISGKLFIVLLLITQHYFQNKANKTVD